jgi:hypothetical protein
MFYLDQLMRMVEDGPWKLLALGEEWCMSQAPRAVEETILSKKEYDLLPAALKRKVSLLCLQLVRPLLSPTL